MKIEHKAKLEWIEKNLLGLPIKQFQDLKGNCAKMRLGYYQEDKIKEAINWTIKQAQQEVIDSLGALLTDNDNINQLVVDTLKKKFGLD